jgi:hypothetical protein
MCEASAKVCARAASQYGYGRKLQYLCSRKSLEPGATLLRVASILGALAGSTWFVSHKRVISSALTGPLGSHRVT